MAFLGVTFSLLKIKTNMHLYDTSFFSTLGETPPLISSMGSLGIIGAILVPVSLAALVWQQEHLILLVMVGLGVLLWWLAGNESNGVTEEDRAIFILDDGNPAIK
ncbi:MAG TPA: hypothetical protein VLM20_09045 [Methylophilaceae bacterium]|nr:hypothetical protein [Methylophilaceae bacterium]